jgi:hypothetical protein
MVDAETCFTFFMPFAPSNSGVAYLLARLSSALVLWPWLSNASDKEEESVDVS